MAAELVGGALLSASLDVLLDRLACAEVVDYLRGKKLNDELINNLKTVLSAVDAVLEDAEEKQITNTNVKQWLDELEDASCDADDLLDEIATHALQSKMEAGSRTNGSKFLDFIFTLKNDRDLKNKLELVLKRLKFLEERIYVLGLINGVGCDKPLARPPTTSLIEEFEVYGRDGDKEAIIKLLLKNDDDGRSNKVSVIPIVGMGGIGKTTLAQSVYNDGKVDKQFEHKAWVCVSDEFDICKVTKTILCAVTKSHYHSYDFTDLDSLQTMLKERLMRRKFLIVLDDVWNENYVSWENMSRPFKHGALGSKILVTTRNEGVAHIMRTVPIYYIEHLRDEDCWQLFAKHAFDNGDLNAYPELETIGRRVFEKCKGLPLAVKTIGGLLRSRLDVAKWKRISENEIWDFSDNESNILPALRLSYHYLPSHLKRCFAFCSIFPKDYKFQRHQLVLLWMAENLLQQGKKNKRMEDVGDEYFNELVSRSFFQRSSSAQESSCFVLHNLVHDFAKYVSREYGLILEEGSSTSTKDMVKVSHLVVSSLISLHRFNSISQSTRLRTFLPLSENSFSYLTNEVVNNIILKLRRLRVLSLSGCENMNQLSESIGELKHLRFLNLSRTSIERLPNSVSLLYNLQNLNLSRCHKLIELPTDMHNLISLRHFDISESDNIMEMPRQISKLTNLHTLSTFIVGKDDGTKIGELRELSDLHGEFCLENLQNVASAKDASEAKLVDKSYLEALCFSWKGDTNDSQHAREVLEELLPHTNLKSLSIHGYGGTKFPNWLGCPSFCNISIVRLENCKYCNCLPPLGQLPSLKALYIRGLSGVVTVGAEFYGLNDASNSVRKPFESLEFLSFNEMLAWEEWSSIEVTDGEVFSRLQQVEIYNCGRLNTAHLPHTLPCSTKLIVDGNEVLVSSLQSTPAIHDLDSGKFEELQLQNPQQAVRYSQTIEGFHGAESLLGGLRKLKNIQILCLSNCSLSIPFPEGCLPNTLIKLKLMNCEKLEFPFHHSLKATLEEVTIEKSCVKTLVSFPLDFFPSLDFLYIQGCESLESLTISNGQQCQNLKSLHIFIGVCPNFISFPERGPHVHGITIGACDKLKALPEGMCSLYPSLKNLLITHCQELESFPEGGLPSNLLQLDVLNCYKLIANRKKWNLQNHLALVQLTVRDELGRAGVESFPEEGLLPSTLVVLNISGIQSLKRLNIKGLQQITSLQCLGIKSCPQLLNLPQEKLPASLRSLSIYKCPILEERCKRGGEDWNKISHIPDIYIDLVLQPLCHN